MGIPYGAYIPAHMDPTWDLYTHVVWVTVYQFVSSSALGLKARVNKKGEFPPGGVGEVPLCIIHVGTGKFVHPENLLFTLCKCVVVFC